MIHENFKHNIRLETHSHTQYKRIFGGLLYPSHYYLKLLSISNKRLIYIDVRLCRYWPNHYKTRALLYKISTHHAFVLIFVHSHNTGLFKNVCMMQFITSFDIFFFVSRIKRIFSRNTPYQLLVVRIMLYHILAYHCLVLKIFFFFFAKRLMNAYNYMFVCINVSDGR